MWEWCRGVSKDEENGKGRPHVHLFSAKLIVEGVSVFCNVSIAEDVDKTWKASICAMDLCISAESKTDLSVKRLQKNVYDRETQICSGRAQVDA